MNVEQLGIEDLTPLVQFGVNLTTEIKSDLADKKFTFQEVMGLVDNFMAIPNLIEKKDSIIAQAKDLSLDEASQISSIIGKDLNNEKIARIVGKSLNWIVATKDMIEEF